MSKIVTITLGRADGTDPQAEGWVIIGYSAGDGGGYTNIGAIVKRNPDGTMPSWADVATLLANNLGRNEWPQTIKGKASGNAVRLSVPDEIDTICFSAVWNPALDQSAATEANPDFVQIAEEKF